ncbi:mitochondrial protein C2orf69 homolog [Mytilus trossulus]|uniref:mitochondrial protein C2orf69 homolog n=1 Tax=Mytilus trossulus TaxID=6551 RepID=UPI00300797AD
MTSSSTTSELQSLYTVQRFENVTGDQDKQNDLILCFPSAINPTKSLSKTVIFFGGDVQNYPEIMSQHRTNNLYLHWNLESTARILAKRFEDSLIIVIKPKEMLLNTFSIYSNFVEFDQDGIPMLFTYTNSNGLTHLSKLYSKALELYQNRQACDLDKSSEKCDTRQVIGCSAELPVSFVGFSKGCVPLNQVLFEVATKPLSPETSDFVSKIKSVYWLDAGHNGRQDTWITSEFVLQKIASTTIELFVHITPYQIKDINRPWIGKEQRKFIQKLKAFKANVTETRHHFDEPGSLDLHFSILTEF